MQKREPAWKANGTIAPCVFVKPDATGDELVIQATAASDPCGISQEGQKLTPGLVGSDAAIAAAAGDAINVHGLGEICYLSCSGAVSHGDYLKPSTGGVGIKTTSAGDIVGARALQASVQPTSKVLVQVINKLL